MSSSGVRMPLTTRLLSRRLSRLKLRYAASSVPGTSGMAATPQLTRRNSITSGFRKHSKCGALGWQPDKHGFFDVRREVGHKWTGCSERMAGIWEGWSWYMLELRKSTFHHIFERQDWFSSKPSYVRSTAAGANCR